MASEDNYRITSVSPNLVQIEVLDTAKFSADHGSTLTLGSYLKISDDNRNAVIAVVQSYKAKQDATGNPSADLQPSVIIDAQPVGYLVDGKFHRGGQQLTIPPKGISLATPEDLKAVYASVEEERQFVFGGLAHSLDIDVPVDGDRFFGTHVAVVGSTGSGKSCTVARILQEGIQPSSAQHTQGILNNSHIVVFDLHGEYRTAFPKCNALSVENLTLPYWLLTSEELEELFVEISNEQNHNQRAQFRQAVIENKRRHNSELEKVSYDAPVYFSLAEVRTYLTNMNSEVISKMPDELCPKVELDELPDGRQLIDSREKYYFEKVLKFIPTSQAKDAKASNGPLHGDLDRFLLRLDVKLNDDRLAFLLKPSKSDGSEYKSEDLSSIIEKLVATISGQESNITVIDLSGIPFEVLSTVVSLISRLLFDVCFHWKRSMSEKAAAASKASNSPEWPLLMVYEEAHKYVPKGQGAAFGAVSRSIERIAKEGRKYGISLMIVSQRPSEISETIFSQCNNVVAMRLTNPTDQQYVQRLLPDAISAITDRLPSLDKQEALVIGDSIPIPTIIKVKDVTDKPDSRDVRFHTEWKRDWLNMKLEEVVTRISKK